MSQLSRLSKIYWAARERFRTVFLRRSAEADMDDNYFPPTLFDRVGSGSLLARDEIFGPVAGLFRVDGFDAAMALLNESRFGLSAGLCTRCNQDLLFSHRGSGGRTGRQAGIGWIEA